MADIKTCNRFGSSTASVPMTDADAPPLPAPIIKPKPPVDDATVAAIVANNLTFAYQDHVVLRNFDMHLEQGSRCLLVGANGAGKSTLLKVLAGKNLTKPDGAVVVLGMDPFRDIKLNLCRAFLDTMWGMTTVAFAGYGVPLMADIPVCGMMSALQNEYPERRDELIELLGIDLDWRMNRVSDGQRRRV